MIPITQGKIGGLYTIQKVKGKLADRLQLEEFGIVLGAQIKLYTIIGNQVICVVPNQRISISRDLANNIFVNEE